MRPSTSAFVHENVPACYPQRTRSRGQCAGAVPAPGDYVSYIERVRDPISRNTVSVIRAKLRRICGSPQLERRLIVVGRSKRPWHPSFQPKQDRG